MPALPEDPSSDSLSLSVTTTSDPAARQGRAGVSQGERLTDSA